MTDGGGILVASVDCGSSSGSFMSMEMVNSSFQNHKLSLASAVGPPNDDDVEVGRT